MRRSSLFMVRVSATNVQASQKLKVVGPSLHGYEHPDRQGSNSKTSACLYKTMNSLPFMVRVPTADVQASQKLKAVGPT